MLPFNITIEINEITIEINRITIEINDTREYQGFQRGIPRDGKREFNWRRERNWDRTFSIRCQILRANSNLSERQRITGLNQHRKADAPREPV